MEIDWTRGIGKKSGVAKNCSVVITGDWAPIRDFAEPMRLDPAGIYGDTLEVLRAADLRIVNLECPLDGDDPIVKSGPNLKGSPEHLPGFNLAGFDVATLANNHICDYSRKGLLRTSELLDRSGVRHLGAGLNAAEATAPLVIETNGVKLGVVNFTEGHDLTAATESGYGVAGWDIDLTVSRIQELRRSCDTVLAVAHVGAEYVPYPPDYIQHACRRIADAGADAVIAHHPHVPQGIEIRGGTPIFYSLGNYVFYQAVDFFYRKIGFLAELEIGKSGLAGFRLHPYEITDGGVRLLRGEKFDEFMRLMRKLSEPLPEHGNEAWNAVLKARWRRGFVPEDFGLGLRLLDTDPRKAAATLRNRLTTKQHYEIYLSMFTRVMNGEIDDAPEEYFAMAEEYYNRRIPCAPVDSRK